MRYTLCRVWILGLMAGLSPVVQGEDAPILVSAEYGGRCQVQPKSENISTQWDGDSLVVQVDPRPSTSAIHLYPQEGNVWDLSKHGHVEAMITNLSQDSFRIFLRVDNQGDWRDEPWNTEAVRVQPGTTVPVKVIFGHQYGFNPGYRLDPSAVSGLVVFTGKNEKPLHYRIEYIRASGKAGEKPYQDPEKVRHRPVDGFLLGGPVELDPIRQVLAQPPAKLTVFRTNEVQGVEVKWAGAPGKQTVSLKPESGKWDLGLYTDVRVRIRNTGMSALKTSAFVQNGNKHEATEESKRTVLQPGERGELTVSFVSSSVWQGPQGDFSQKSRLQGTGGTTFKSDRTGRVVIEVDHPGSGAVQVEEIRGIVQSKPRPEWLGTRPPVAGDWTVTLDEEFLGNQLDTNRWDTTGPNYWGIKKLTHWSKDNVWVKDGVATLRLEKKFGPHNDDPNHEHSSDYQGGILRSYDTFSQLYGYWETRVKLPTETAMWPAFWLMPDRGSDAGDKYQRQSTNDGGMEFDIMEHLTRWGPYRYTTALHWDGYNKGHKATGVEVYFYPDEEGYVTSGLLWLPGFMAYYCNGQEVARWEHERISSVPSAILYTMPIGGWDNEKYPVDEELPADFIIDYVRVWQRADLF